MNNSVTTLKNQLNMQQPNDLAITDLTAYPRKILKIPTQKLENNDIIINKKTRNNSVSIDKSVNKYQLVTKRN